MAKYKISGDGVKDTETGACIPFAEGNRHYREYQEWLAQGNTPDPEFTQPELDAMAVAEEIGDIKNELRNVMVWQFRMIMQLWEIGKAKGVWDNTDITDETLKTHVANWQTKLDRLGELGE